MNMQLFTTKTEDGLVSPDAFAEREDGYRTGVDLLALDEAGWEAQRSSMPLLTEAERAEVYALASKASGVVAQRAVTPDPELTYAQKRRREYPSYADQFDLIYHAIKAGDAGLTEFVAAIDAVKTKYQKPKD